MPGISDMTQRFERWLIVGACLVLYGLAMALFAWAIHEPTQRLSNWLGATFGQGWGLVIAAVPPVAAGIWAWWPNPQEIPVKAANANWPRWVRIVGNTYLALLGIGLVIVFAVIAIFE